MLTNRLLNMSVPSCYCTVFVDSWLIRFIMQISLESKLYIHFVKPSYACLKKQTHVGLGKSREHQLLWNVALENYLFQRSISQKLDIELLGKNHTLLALQCSYMDFVNIYCVRLRRKIWKQIWTYNKQSDFFIIFLISKKKNWRCRVSIPVLLAC